MILADFKGGFSAIMGADMVTTQDVANWYAGRRFEPRFSITESIAAALTRIERARGFLDAAKLSDDWLATMSSRALLLEAHHTTHIEGRRLTLEQAEQTSPATRLRTGSDDVRDLLNYRDAFEFVSRVPRRRRTRDGGADSRYPQAAGGRRGRRAAAPGGVPQRGWLRGQGGDEAGRLPAAAVGRCTPPRAGRLWHG